MGVISSFWFRVLPEMSPSSRLVAFFVGQDGEVIADSTLIEINDGLPNKVNTVLLNSSDYRGRPCIDFRFSDSFANSALFAKGCRLFVFESFYI